MELSLPLLVIFLTALAAPMLVARSSIAGWLLAAVPACLTAYFLTKVPAVSDGETISTSFEWVPALGIDFALRLDGLSLLFAVLICGIGAMVVLYSSVYLAGKPYVGRFYAIMFVFMGAMLGLVLANDLIVMFVFWELTSVSSYGLISIESERAASRYAALQALLVTAGGGLAMLAGLVILNVATGTQSISEITAAGSAALEDSQYYDWIVVLILAGAFTKSAQFPFHFWLPNAMEAPTPVSAYLHSATMVKAGVYLLARMTPALAGTDLWFYTLTLAGGLTMVLASALSLRETDLKRILAYVTLSILGALVMLIGVGTEEALLAAIGLLLAHALYKACLFLVAGIVDHETGTREISALGGLGRAMPVTAACAMLAGASMAALPLTFGFIAKELTYESLLHSPDLRALVIAAAVLANALMFAVAIIVGVRPFFGPKTSQETHDAHGHERHLHDPGIAFLAGPVILGGLGLIFGLVPSLAGANLVIPAASAATGHELHEHLSIWHGFNQAFQLSLLTFALGGIAYYARASIRTTMRFASVSLKLVSPENIYNVSIAGLNALATGQTRVLQNGYLRAYIATIFVAMSALVLGTLLIKSEPELPDETSGLLAYEVIIAVVMLGGAALAVVAASRLVAAVALGMVGYGVGLIYILFGAPDLAMTQVLVETLAVLLFVFAFQKLPRFRDFSRRSTQVRDLLVATAAGATVTILLLTTLSRPKEHEVSDMIAEASKPIAHGSNIVNVILVDFRALDTLGEMTVLGIAAIGIMALFRWGLRSRDEG